MIQTTKLLAIHLALEELPKTNLCLSYKGRQIIRVEWVHYFEL